MICKTIFILALLVGFGSIPVAGQSPQVVIDSQGEALEREYETLESGKKALNDDCGIVSSSNKAKLESCAERKSLLLERIGKYQRDLASFIRRKEEVELIQRELAPLDARLTQTRKTILQFEASLPGFQRSLEEWTQLDEEAKAKARRASIDGTITLVLERLTLHFEATAEDAHQSQVALARWRNRRYISDNEDVRARWRALDQQIDQAHNQGDIVAAVTAFWHAVEAIRDRHEVERALLAVVGMINAVWVRNSAIGLLLLDGELILTDAYTGTARFVAAKRVAQLAELSEDRLRGLQSLTSLYVKDVDRKHRLLKREAELLKP
jgi:hypothetical protein